MIVGTTDVHGWLRGWDYYENRTDTTRGLARAATVVDSLRAAHPGRTILVDAGDLLQGNPLAYVAAKLSTDTANPIVAAMNAMAYDAMAIGNHEFNYGLPYLDRAVAQARFPWLSTNSYRTDGSRKYAGWTLVERAGVRVGIIGATTPGVNVWDRDNVKGRMEVRDIVPEVRAAVAEVRQRGVDLLVVVVHSGLAGATSYDTSTTGAASENVSARLAHEVSGIDLIVYGHSHRQMADTTIGSTTLVQPKNWAASVSATRVTLERSGGGWRVVEKRGSLIPVAGRREAPSVLAATERAHNEALSYVTATIGGTPVAWRADSARVRDTPLIDLILETQRAAARTDLASTAAFSLDASLDTGAITVAEVARLYPYDNTLRAIRITGRQLRDYLEQSARYFGTSGTSEPAVHPAIPGFNFDIVSGADYTIDVSRPPGSRITRLEVGGRPVRDDDSFTLALNNYRQTGGGGYAMLSGAPVIYESTADIRQLLIDEVRRRGTIQPADVFTRNWELVPAGAVGPAYAEMFRGPFAPRRPVTAAGEGARRSNGARIRIIATNDFHGALEPRPDARGVMRGGAAALATAIRRAATGCDSGCALLLLDGGDLFQGTPASNFARGRPVVQLYNELGYVAAALGNHEFDWGRDTLRARMREARFAILGANVRYADGRDVPWIRDDTLVRRGGITIGLIGVATVETPRTTMAANVRGLRFDDPGPIVLERARALRGRGAEAIVVLAHAGAFCRDEGTNACDGEIVRLAQATAGAVDAIVSGHTHSIVQARINGVPVVQARSRGQAIGVLDLAVGGLEESVVRVEDILSDSLPPDPRVDSLVRRWVAAVASRVNRPVARIAADLPREGSALGHLIADAQRWVGHADVALTNAGGIRAPLRAGVATYGSLFEVQPFENALVQYVVRGRVLRDYLERTLTSRGGRSFVSGVTVQLDSSRSEGSRIVSLRLASGKPVSAEGRYSIVLNHFLATGEDGAALERLAIRRTPLRQSDLEALIAYLRSRPQPVTAPSERRVTWVAP